MENKSIFCLYFLAKVEDFFASFSFCGIFARTQSFERESKTPKPMTPPTHRQALPEGYMLQEYQLGRVLGAGGFGLTYLGWDTALDKAVAVKEYLPNELAVREADNSVVAKSGGDEDNFR